MKELLIAIKAALKSIDGVTVFVTPHENFLPRKTRMPAIGIKDGAIQRREGVSLTMETTMEVKLIAWVGLAKDEGTILGDSSANQMGIIDLSDAIHARLDDNLLGLDGVISAFSPSEAGADMVGDNRETLENKVITYNYEKQGDRPCTTR